MIIDRFENHASIYSVDRPLDFVVVPPCCRKVFMHEPLAREWCRAVKLARLQIRGSS